MDRVSTGTIERKDFAASKELRDVMGRYFADLGRGASEGKKTAWCTSVGPAELLRALGFNVYFPENHGAMLGASRMATDLIPAGQRPRVLARHLLLSHQRRRLVSEGREPAAEDEARRPAQGRRAGVQHQPVPRREGLVPVLRPRVERALPGRPHAAGHRRRRSSHWSISSPGRSRASSSRSSKIAGRKLDIDRLRDVIDRVAADDDAVEGRAGNRGRTSPRRSPSSTARSRWARPW